MKKILIFSLLLIPLLFSPLQGQTSQYYIEQIDSAVTDVRDRLWEGYTNDLLDNNYYDNTFVGRGNLQRTRNSALGVGALSSYIRDGAAFGDTSDNTAIGFWSMRLLTTGHYNTGAGIHTLGRATTAFDNDAFGAGALANLTTGIRNTAIGNFAMHGSQTVSYNVAIGRGALSNLASGGFNTALGINAGGYLVHNSVPFTTGSNNTFLGYATYPQAEGDNNSIVIGYYARGKGTNTTVIGDSNNTATYLYGTLYVDDVEFPRKGEDGYYAFEDATTILSIITQNSWYHVTNLGNNLFSRIQDSTGFAISGDTLRFISNHAADTNSIKFIWAIEGGGIGGQTYEFRLYNVTKNSPVIRKAGGIGTGSTADISIGTLSYAVNVSYGDRFILQVRNITGTGDFTARRGSIYAEVSSY